MVFKHLALLINFGYLFFAMFLEFQNHDIVKLSFDNVESFNIMCSLIFGFLLFFPYRKAATSFKPSLPLDKAYTDVMRGIAIIAIIIAHFGYYVPSHPVDFKFIGRLGIFGVPIFFFLSGYGLSESSRKNGVNNFLENRFAKVFIPVAICSIFILILNAILSRVIHDPFSYLLFVVCYRVADKSYWFVWLLYFWYIGFYLSHKLFPMNENHRIVFLFLISIFLLFPGKFTYDVKASALMFPLGILWSFVKEKPTHFKKVLLFSAFCIAPIALIDAGPQMNKVLYHVFYTLAILFVAKWLFVKRIPIAYQFLGKISFEMFLLHFVFLYSYDFILWRAHLHFSFFIYLIFVIVLSIAANKFFKKIYIITAALLIKN